jgi:hypothetical protein
MCADLYGEVIAKVKAHLTQTEVRAREAGSEVTRQHDGRGLRMLACQLQSVCAANTRHNLFHIHPELFRCTQNLLRW